MNVATYALLLCYMVAAFAGHVIFWQKRQEWTSLLISALWLGFGLQVFMLMTDGLRHGHAWGSASFNFVFVLVTLWTGSAVILHALTRKNIMALFAGPIALGCLAAASIFPVVSSPQESPLFKGAWLSLHIHLILLAYAALGLGFMCATAYLATAFRLQQKKLLPANASVSLESLSTWVSRLNGGGLVLLSFGLVSGWIWATLTWTGGWLLDAKVLASVTAWVLTGAVVFLRNRGKLQGRLGMWLTVLSFVVILLGLLLDRFIPSTYHRFL